MPTPVVWQWPIGQFRRRMTVRTVLGEIRIAGVDPTRCRSDSSPRGHRRRVLSKYQRRSRSRNVDQWWFDHRFRRRQLRSLALRLLHLQCFPDLVRRLADALMHHQFSCQRGEDVGAIVHCLQAAIGEFALDRHRDQKFPSHEPKATDLGRVLIAEESDGHGLGLANSPTPAAGLPQRKSGVSGLIPDNCRAEYQVEPGLNKTWMSDKSLHAGLELAFAPRLPALQAAFEWSARQL